MSKTEIPSIRFRGFDDAWEQRKFDEAFIERQNKTEKENEDILLSCAINGMFLNSELFGHFRGTTTIGYLRVKKNDLILSAQNLHLGNANVNLRFEHGIISPAYKVYDLNNCNPEFVQSWVKRDDTKNFFLAATTEGASQCRKNIEWETLGKQTISMPSLDEQKRVGSFFSQLDHLITLHQRKFEKLTNVKKSMLEKMFPRNGSCYPEIRFNEFTDPWEQRKFSELYEKISKKNDLTYGKNDIISVANMYFKPDAYITDDSYLLTYNIFELGDIAFEGNKSKNFAHGRFVENTIGNGIVSHVFDVFKPIMSPYDLLFWKYAINNEGLMGQILLRSTKASTMMTNLVANDFLQEKFFVPSYPEQQKIGAFLDQLDHLITLHQRELEKLQSIKKALLEKMFV